MKILVCGGRDYGEMKQRPGESEGAATDRALAERATFFAYMDGLIREIGPFEVIEGCAPGADSLAEEWASAAPPYPLHHFPANWRPNGPKGYFDRGAGPKRNRQMLVEGQPDLVVAFPGGSGTANMIQQAERAGVPVRRVE